MTLLEAAKLGDDSAFELLLSPLLEPGYRLAGGMLQDHQAAQDAVQEAAFKAWRKLRQLRDGSDTSRAASPARSPGMPPHTSPRCGSLIRTSAGVRPASR
jgi:hypothetical protein